MNQVFSSVFGVCKLGSEANKFRRHWCSGRLAFMFLFVEKSTRGDSEVSRNPHCLSINVVSQSVLLASSGTVLGVLRQACDRNCSAVLLTVLMYSRRPPTLSLQLTIELGRDDRRRKWRLQCRTRGSAELLVSIMTRISLERMAQKKQGGWWRR